MIDIYATLATLAAALQASTTLRDYSITNFGKGCLIQIDDLADNPVSDADAPFVVLCKADPGEMGAAASHGSMTMRMTAGVSVPASAFKTTHARTTAANGLRELEAGKYAEGLLRAALTACKAVHLGSGILLEGASPDVDVFTWAPLQMAACNVEVRQPQTLDTW